MNELLKESVFFGASLSIAAFWISAALRKKWDLPLFHPLLVSTALIIACLSIFRIDYETYEKGAGTLTYFLTPATVCLALPLYRQIKILKQHTSAIVVSISCGCASHLLILFILSRLFHLEEDLALSLLSKSVTTPIAIGITGEIGGIQAVTVAAVCLAGILGAAAGPALFKLLHITEPIAQGLGLGAASHAVGTSRAMELGEIQGAMSSLAIVVTGILTVAIVPAAAGFLF